MTISNGRRGQMLCAAVFLCVVGIAAPVEADETSYVLALSWQPGFCVTVRGADKGECRPVVVERLTLHGLWPNADRNGDGRLDAGDDYCLAPAERETAIARDKADWRQLPPVKLPDDLQQDLAQVMPGTVSQLDRHQWIKHGTCSGFDAARYFAAAVALTKAVVKTDLGQLIADRAGEEVARRDLLQAFSMEFGAGSERALQLLCRKDDARAYLTEIRLRLYADAVEAPLEPASMDMTKAAKGVCPARFVILQ